MSYKQRIMTQLILNLGPEADYAYKNRILEREKITLSRSLKNKGDVPVIFLSKEGIDLYKEFAEGDYYVDDVEYYKRISLDQLVDMGHAIIDLIIERQYLNGKSLFAYISYKEIRRVKERPRSLVDFLISRDIISCNGSYVPGVRSKGYRISR